MEVELTTEETSREINIILTHDIRKVETEAQETKDYQDLHLILMEAAAAIKVQI